MKMKTVAVLCSHKYLGFTSFILSVLIIHTIAYCLTIFNSLCRCL